MKKASGLLQALAVLASALAVSPRAEEQHGPMTALSGTTISGVVDTSAIWAAQSAPTVLFEDNFETDTSANWDVFEGSGSNTPDFTAQFGFVYTTNSYTSNGVRLNIPAAPNSTGNTNRGVKLTVNKNDDTADEAGVSIYPKGKSFTGNYALRFDMWINYNGGEYGGSGSTEFATFGVNHTGTQVNWQAPATKPGALTTSDGIWFAVTGEAGAANDYRSLEGDPGGGPLPYNGADGGFLDRDGDGRFEQEVIDVDSDPANYPLNLMFPRPPFETTGVPGKRWVQVEVRQRDGTITWLMNGYVIAEKQNSGTWTQGNIMLGTMDIFASIASPKADNFVIFDNVRVVDLGTGPALPRVSAEATTASAAEPGTSGEITLTRDGDTAQALTVSYRLTGTATAGQDYTAVPLTTNIPAGSTTVTIPIAVINDQRAEPTESVRLVLLGGMGAYEVAGGLSAGVEIADDNDPTAVSIAAADPWAYEGIASDSGLFRITRIGDTAAPLTVNLGTSGTAQSGADYQALASSVVIEAGQDSATVRVIPVNNTVNDGNRTLIAEIRPGTGYVLGTPTNATVTIRNDDGMEAGTLVFSDTFDSDTSAQWVVNEAHAGANRATFAFDYSTAGIPSAPHSTGGSTAGLKLEANVGAPTFTGLSVSPADKAFEGDYRLSFDMWINYPGPLPAGGVGSTMSLSAGLGTGGTVAQFPGSSVEGVLFSVTGDGGSGSDWRAYAATGAPLATNSGAYAAGMGTTVLNNTDPYYAPFGRAAAPEAQLALFPDQTGLTSVGAPGMAWHEVVIEKRGTNISWFVDNLRIATITLTNKQISSNIFVGFFDINATQVTVQDMAFGLIDNLKVETLASVPTGELKVTSIRRDGQNVVIDFTIPSNLTAFSIEGSATVDGGYASEATAQITTVSATERRATIPLGTGNRFFRVRGQ